MRKQTIIGMSLAMALLLVASASPVGAGKPIDVIPKSNGFPSGPHFNLNLHAQDPAWTPGDIEPYGNSIWISNDGSDNTIEYVSNKKNTDNLTLYVIDPLSEAFGPPYDAAQVYLPYNVWDDDDDDGVVDNGEAIDAGGYRVFGRILGKPNNGKEGPSTVMVYPNVVISANATDNTTWPWGADEALIDAGLITSGGNLYQTTADGEFERFVPDQVKGKGKSPAKEITDLFMWSGYVTDNASLDASGNGSLDIFDLRYSENTSIRTEWLAYEADWLEFYEPQPAPASDGEVLDEAEFLAWLAWMADVGTFGVTFYDGWIFDVADMVISGQTVVSDGAKLFQIRFYPINLQPEYLGE